MPVDTDNLVRHEDREVKRRQMPEEGEISEVQRALRQASLLPSQAVEQSKFYVGRLASAALDSDDDESLIRLAKAGRAIKRCKEELESLGM